jgi:hypothetical protein
VRASEHKATLLIEALEALKVGWAGAFASL